jgi:hypothetical protein
LPGAEDFAVGQATVTPVEVDEPSVAADVASVGADIASVAADMPSVEAEAEAVRMVDAGSLYYQLEALAADGICRRPLRFRSPAAATFH